MSLKNKTDAPLPPARVRENKQNLQIMAKSTKVAKNE
jgi:hypothetical protein